MVESKTSTNKIVKLTKKEISTVEKQRKQVELLKEKDITKSINFWKKDGSSFQCWACQRCAFMHENDKFRIVNFIDPRDNTKHLFGFCLLGRDSLKMRKGKDLICYGFLFFPKKQDKE